MPELIPIYTQNGDPCNIAAAATDALAWLEIAQASRNNLATLPESHRVRLDYCVRALKYYVRQCGKAEYLPDFSVPSLSEKVEAMVKRD